ncbi:hypothetical protein [Psychrobacillus phage Perkons]|nr:hypothetical protein [Psychrobacillus phage Perkons]
MKLLRVSGKALNSYRKSVKGNEFTTKDQARRKLTRNVALANEVLHKSEFQRFIGTKVYTYGNLHITVRFGKVVEIVNHSGGHHYKSWKKDMKKYAKLTKELNITD